MKLKSYRVFKSGGEHVETLFASCITKAAQKYISTLGKAASYEIQSTAQASIRFADNHNVMSDFIVVET